MNSEYLSGVYAAALTPLKADGSIDLEGIPLLLNFLAKRGCHGVLLLGTTGEGPSFSYDERSGIIRAALAWRKTKPEFHLLAGTGTPSLTETIGLTKTAFELGIDGVVVLPPYYYRKVTDEGLYTWFSQVLRQAVPEGGVLMGYNIPPMTGVPFSLDLLSRLRDSFPHRFAGIKDSSGDAEYARQLGRRFGHELLVMNGNDRLFSLALEMEAYGCITALANVISPLLRGLWDAVRNGQLADNFQQQLNAARDVADRYTPAPPLLKALLARQYGLPEWAVRPPLVKLPVDYQQQAIHDLQNILKVTESLVPAVTINSLK